VTPAPAPAATALTASWLGRVEYPAAWSWQQELYLARLDGDVGDTLMLLEHPPTYTLGRRGTKEDLVYGDRDRAARGISLYEVDRGGRATYHGPGQLVGYPILELGDRYDVISYLRKLEDVLIRVAAALGVEAHRDDEHTGVWITRGISMHGFAFNVATDLSMFEGIVPCGIRDRWVTSVAAETGKLWPLKEVATLAAVHLAEVFGRTLVWTHPRSLHRSGHITAGAL
jgi:lipoyl(octanoyl) transferase